MFTRLLLDPYGRRPLVGMRFSSNFCSSWPSTVMGPPFGSYSRQRREGRGYALQAFVIDWEAQQARYPQGQTSVHWRLGHNVSGDPVIRIRFDWATCRPRPTRQVCTSARGAPRQLTVRLQARHEVLQTARQRQ
jgi:transposase